ncbi:MAG: putative SnoaL-like aldol condensation-catalyzing enzyme [Myxococcota bacterium]|jgi:predicted SnoaL-like aldol condensation-catalyzing enzyme
MTLSRIDRIRTLLKGIETGDPASVSVISPIQYIQHNPQTHTGREGLAALFARLSKTSPRVNIVRAFTDGDFVFGQTEYDFATRRIGFEVFRFEGDLTVEHWDNIQPRKGPNPAGHSMVDGPTEATDLDRTEENRALVRAFVETVCIAGKRDALDAFVSTDHYTEHHPTGVDGAEALRARLEGAASGPGAVVYRHLHRVLAQGSFVLAVSEGERGGIHTAFCDLYRVAEGKLVEHWDTVEAVAPPEEWKHDNGKF